MELAFILLEFAHKVHLQGELETSKLFHISPNGQVEQGSTFNLNLNNSLRFKLNSKLVL